MQRTTSALVEINQAFIDQLSDGFLQINKDGSIIYANQMIKDWIGVETEQLIGKKLIRFFPEVKTDKNQEGAWYRTVLASVDRQAEIVELSCFPKRDGRTDLLVRYIENEDEMKDSGDVSISKNHSALQKAQQALLESEYRYRQLVEHSPDPVCLHDSEKILYVNDVAVEMLGIKDKSDIIGKSTVDFIHPDYREDSGKRVEKVMKGHRFTRLFPIKLIRPDGAILEMEGKSIPIKENGNTYVLAVFRDVTEKNYTKKSLLHSERRYRSLFQHNPDGIYSLNLKGELTSINPAIVTITGFPEEEQIGRQYTDFLLADEKEEVVANYEKIFTGKTVKFEKHMTRKDGETITVRVVGFPMIVDDEIIGMYGILRDITDEKKSQEMLRRSEKLTVVGELAAAIAHEIRNPLTSIKGFIQMMEDGLEDKELYYQIVLSELDRIEQIISELLLLAKPQSICFEKKKAGNLIRHVLKLLEGQANLHNIQFITDLEADSELIDCEENQLKQVFINLIKNAIEVMPDGGKIMISSRKRKDGKLLIKIKDQGPGIPKDKMSRLGEPFYTTKEKGTGLGLMVSFKIIKDHKGTIQFSSSEHDGTTVDVLLPLP
ncbi:PAS domain S-box protein [Pseudalkalibacillus salsuginis]|uniref:PAS domain S-box protein n=1 Tax=Pseudalkalibacillus salsuginis TaxID=2910972 RepID=UPI001F2838F5|nr:PAS domain-containing sensor histidine kinase [Pseudalkalibacillus salsuginis]MCF6410880.1 PAS domain S-box protein [Pseudalkalibacillus salsuginis]